MNNKLKILIIESDQTISDELEKKVSDLGYKFCSSASPEWPIDELIFLSPELTILGPSLDTETTLKSIHKLKIMDALMPVLISNENFCQPEISLSTPVDGIYCINQDPEPNEIGGTIDKALKNKNESELLPDFSVLIGQSQEMIDIRHKIKSVADKDITVLVTGETGTGKELIARSIHFHSPRNKGPLVKINCVALPDELIESEVFGFQRGAFTGAHKDKPGRLELADGGTLFIDEIGSLSLSVQVKFLQVLEDKSFSRLGGTRDKILNVRVVAATNSDLGNMVREGTFRKDLFYRLNVMHINISPLRERAEDIPLLTHYFLNKYCFELKKEILDVPEDVINFFLTHFWPGNVRELENVIRRAIVLRDWDFILDELRLTQQNQELGQDSESDGDEPPIDWPENQMKKFFEDKNFSLKQISKAYVSEAERLLILNTLRSTDWNRKKAAKRLRVSYKTLLNRIEDFNLKP